MSSENQRCSFEKDINILKREQPYTETLRKLAPFLDRDGVLRVSGRLIHSALSHESKHPVLSGRHRLTELIVERTHRTHLHPGRRALQYILAQNFWILGTHQTIKRCLSRCYECFRAHPRALQPLMVDLPLERVERQAKPFSISGVDYARPFLVCGRRARGVTPFKCYICIFVCFTTKAIHFELAFSLSTDSFLTALRCFIARRGRCSLLYSDCGTNFMGAHRELVGCMRDASERETIKWSFNPPSAPHFGGLWETEVKSMKIHLKRVVEDQILTVEEFSTVLAQIEAVLNSRPLCPTSDDPQDLEILSPGHFLTFELLVAVPYPSLEPVPMNGGSIAGN